MDEEEDIQKWIASLRSGDPRQGIVARYSRRQINHEDAKIMRLPPAYWTARWDGIQDETIKDLVKKYCDRIVEHIEKGRGLLIDGGSGVGKTCVAAVIAKEARRWGFSVYFVSANDLRENVIEDGQYDNDTTIWGRARSVQLLVIDGFDTELVADKLLGPRHLERLVRGRNDNLLSTIITSDIDWDREQSTCKRLQNTIYKNSVHCTVEGKNFNEKLHADMTNEVLSTDK